MPRGGRKPLYPTGPSLGRFHDAGGKNARVKLGPRHRSSSCFLFHCARPYLRTRIRGTKDTGR